MNRRELLLSPLGLAVLPLDTVFGQGKAPQKWALLIGIDAYSDPSINPLAGAANDALALQKVLMEKLGFPSENVRVLSSITEAKPSRTAILDGLAWLVRYAKSGDTVVVAYSGHGIEIEGVPYLLPYDTSAYDASTIVDSALETSKFQQRLRGVKASVRLYLFDMCRTDPRRSKDAVAPDNKLVAGLKKGLDFSSASPTPAGEAPPVIVTLMACSEGERSWEWRDKKRGFFSYFVEQGLNGEAADETGAVTLASLKDYVGREVPKAVKDILNQLQTPLPSVTSNDQVALRTGIAGKANQKLKATTARLAFSGLPDGSVVRVEGSSVTGEYREDMAEKTKTVSVSISAPGYVLYSGSVEIKRGELVTASPKLMPIPLARLVFPALPGGAVVKIDGKAVDQSVEYREEINSVTKSVELTVSGLAGYKPYVSDVELKRGGIVKAEIALEKRAPDPMPVKEPDPKPGPNQPVVGKGKGARKTRKGSAEMCYVPGNGTISDFWMDATPVTVGQYKAFCAATRKTMPEKTPSWGWIDEHPMVYVTWFDAKAFADWAECELPTSEQFEYAARDGGRAIEYPWGDGWDGSKVWSSVNSTAYVRRSDHIFVNSLSLSDMAGNVWQWCSDGPDSSSKYIKGGSWNRSNAIIFRCAYRSYGDPTSANDNDGFRLSSRT